MGFVRDKDHRPVPPFREKLDATFLVEPAVPDSNDLVYKETVEVHGHGDGKREAGAHARGVCPKRLLEILPQLGEIFDERQGLLEICAVNPANKAEVVHSGKAPLKSAGECERPGHPHPAHHSPAGGFFRAADNPNQRAFAGSVPAEDTQLLAGLDGQVDPIEHDTRPGPRRIGLRDILKRHHAG